MIVSATTKDEQIRQNQTMYKFSNVYLVCEYEYVRYLDCVCKMYIYFGPYTILPHSLVVSVSDFGSRGPGSIPG